MSEIRSGSRLLAVAVAGALAVAALGGGAVWCMVDLAVRLRQSAAAETMLRNHLEADMMHDALRGDVFAALHEAVEHRAVVGGAAVPGPTLTHALPLHVARFRRVSDEKEALAADHPGLAAVLADVSAPLAAYVAEAERLVALAFSDHAAAAAMLHGFEDRFEAIEAAMQTASERLEAVAAAAHAAASAAKTRATALVGLAALLAALATLRRWREVQRGWRELQREVAARRAAEETARALAVHDALTGLPNRRRLAEGLDAALARARRDGGTVAALLVDLDRFKPVNDLRGHAAGDRLLQMAAERLRGTAREVDVVARLGGDEFVVAAQFDPASPTGLAGEGAEEAADAADAASRLARRVVAVLEQPFDLGDGSTPVLVGASVGVALAPDGEGDAEELLRRADLAMYRAKADGRGCFRFFEAAMDARIRERAELEAELRRAVAADELVPHFQPLVALGAGDRLVGFEMLARWPRSGRGMVSPAEFIPLAEDTGLIAPMTENLLRRACRAAASWPSHLTLAVNVSPVQLRDRALPAMVAAALAESGLPARRLEVELTESALVDNFDLARELMGELKALGVRLSLDDFGTGYSSLRHLQTLPFDKIKVDAGFVRNMTGSPESGKIVAAVVGLGHSLGLPTVAEGVEDAATAAVLAGMGCDIGQGWLFGRPAAEAEAGRRAAASGPAVGRLEAAGPPGAP